jgi:hypothetical protein
MNEIILNFEPIFFLSLIITGFLIGIIASMVGIGGGLLLVPILILFFLIDTQKASAISLFVMIFTAGSGSYTYYKQKRIDVRTGLFFALCVIPFSFFGSWIAEKVDEFILVISFGILLLLVSTRRIQSLIKGRKNNSVTKKANFENNQENNLSEKSSKDTFFPRSLEYRKIVDNDGKEFNYTIKMRRTLFGAIIGGFLGGLLGVGGGIIFVPVLTEIGGIPPHIAIATSTFVIIFTALSGSFARLLYGEILFSFAFPLAIGSVIGAKIGATKVKKISSQKILIFFYVIVFLSGVRILLKAFGYFV